jgi:hypothetical protein
MCFKHLLPAKCLHMTQSLFLIFNLLYLLGNVNPLGSALFGINICGQRKGHHLNSEFMVPNQNCWCLFATFQLERCAGKICMWVLMRKSVRNDFMFCLVRVHLGCGRGRGAATRRRAAAKRPWLLWLRAFFGLSLSYIYASLFPSIRWSVVGRETDTKKATTLFSWDSISLPPASHHNQNRDGAHKKPKEPQWKSEIFPPAAP